VRAQCACGSTAGGPAEPSRARHSPGTGQGLGAKKGRAWLNQAGPHLPLEVELVAIAPPLHQHCLAAVLRLQAKQASREGSACNALSGGDAGKVGGGVLAGKRQRTHVLNGGQARDAGGLAGCLVPEDAERYQHSTRSRPTHPATYQSISPQSKALHTRLDCPPHTQLCIPSQAPHLPTCASQASTNCSSSRQYPPHRSDGWGSSSTSRPPGRTALLRADCGWAWFGCR